MEIKHIILHHVGGTQAQPYASSLGVTPQQISAYHKSLWNFPSKHIKDEKLRYAGYNFIYDPKNGQFTQCRAIGEEGAHTIGYNNSSIGICIIGNYTKGCDTINKQTVDDVTRFLYDLIYRNVYGVVVAPDTAINLSIHRIGAHRSYQRWTECYGSGIPNNLFKDELIQYVYRERIKLYQYLVTLYSNLLVEQEREQVFGATERECPGVISL